MTVQVRGVTSAASGTVAVPAGTGAGDLLILLARSYWQNPANTAPWGGLGGWTAVDNLVRGSGGSAAGTEGTTWGVLTATRIATGSEPASYTVTATGGDAIIGAIVAVYSDTGQTLTATRGATNSGPFRNEFQSQFVPSRAAGSLYVHAMSGNGTAITSSSGFTGSRTHHATLGLHSAIPYAWQSVPSGAPYYFERWRDLVMSIDTEAGTLNSGTRIAVSTFNWGVYPAGSGDPNDGTYWSNTFVAVTETAPPAQGGWQGWIID